MSKPKSRGNGQGTAYRRGAGWQARVVIGWKLIGDPPHSCPIYKTKDGFKTKREALEYCPELKRQALGDKSQAPTLEYYWHAYERDLERLSKNKQINYKTAWSRLAPLKNRKIDTITVADLRDIVTEKAATYYTARDMKVLLSHLYDLAGADGWVNRDLPSYIILPQKIETERQPFTDDEQVALWKAYESGNKDAAIPLLMIHTGMMPGELLRLTTEMIDYDEQKILGVGLKTQVRRRSAVYLPSAMIPVLQDVSRGKSGRIWDLKIGQFYDRYYAVLEAAGCRRLTPYSCRHTTATVLAISERIAPQTIQKVMRWSSTKMLDRYSHPSDSDAMEAVETLKK